VQRCSAEPGPISTLPRWTPDQQRTTPQVRRAAQHPGNNPDKAVDDPVPLTALNALSSANSL
jgi:hypothetical protein